MVKKKKDKKNNPINWLGNLLHDFPPLEICLPNSALFVPILRISWFPRSSLEVKLRRELVEEHASWNVEHETFSGISIAKLSPELFSS